MSTLSKLRVYKYTSSDIDLFEVLTHFKVERRYNRLRIYDDREDPKSTIWNIYEPGLLRFINGELVGVNSFSGKEEVIAKASDEILAKVFNHIASGESVEVRFVGCHEVTPLVKCRFIQQRRQHCLTMVVSVLMSMTLVLIESLTIGRCIDERLNWTIVMTIAVAVGLIMPNVNRFK